MNIDYQDMCGMCIHIERSTKGNYGSCVRFKHKAHINLSKRKCKAYLFDKSKLCQCGTYLQVGWKYCPNCGKETVQVNKDDMCQPCHNALQCLEWAKTGYKAKCVNWDYFKQQYASGNKKIVGDETEAGAGD